MFEVTREWLMFNYGSQPNQVETTRQWLDQYGKAVDGNALREWANWKHLAEYQPNTPDIVPKALAMIGQTYNSELEAHRLINMMRVPLSESYEDALAFIFAKKGQCKDIIELGVGGDSAISTSIFLRWAETFNGHLTSVEKNPLGRTWDRYGKYEGSLWTFIQDDSMNALNAFRDGKIKPDVIFIDTSHTYVNTIAEIALASQFCDYLLMDDALFEGNEGDAEPGGVKRAIEEWNKKKNWIKEEFWNGSTVLFYKNNSKKERVK